MNELLVRSIGGMVLTGNRKRSEKPLSQCHFFRHKIQRDGTRAFRLTACQLTFPAMAGVPGSVIRNTLVVFPAGVADFSLLRSFNIKSGVHLAPYSVVNPYRTNVENRVSS